MELSTAIGLMILNFILGASVVSTAIWLYFIGIPYIKIKTWDKFEKKVKKVIKENYDKPMNVTREYLKDLIKEVQNDK